MANPKAYLVPNLSIQAVRDDFSILSVSEISEARSQAALLKDSFYVLTELKLLPSLIHVYYLALIYL